MDDQTIGPPIGSPSVLFERQVELERNPTPRTRRAKKKKPNRANTAAGAALRKRALEPTAAAIERRKGELPAAMQAVDSHVLADLTMRVAISAAAAMDDTLRTQGTTYKRTTRAIAAAVDAHVRDEALAKALPYLRERALAALKHTTNPAFRRRSIDGRVASMRKWALEVGKADIAARLERVEGVEWDVGQIEAGSVLLDCFAASGLVIVVPHRSSKTTTTLMVRFKEEAAAWLAKHDAMRALLRPPRVPMVSPPLPWERVTDPTTQRSSIVGGYLTTPLPFIRGKQNEDLELFDLGKAFCAVSLIQATPYRINRDVYNVMAQVYESTGPDGFAGVPPKRYGDAMRPVPKSRKPDEVEWTSWKNTADGLKWRHAAREAHEHNALLETHALKFLSRMELAAEYVQVDRFWHVHNIDWRQRCYPVCNLLSPQGDEYDRALIEFADGKRMGDSADSGRWLAIHGANTYGEDKVSFEERQAWVEENEALIFESAREPLGDVKWFWTKADKPWMFLAFCYEWRRYREGCKPGEAREDHFTHVIVTVDGSNSGLQHLSLLMRDEDGAAATNVTPSAKPADIYNEVAEATKVELRRLAGGAACGRNHKGKECLCAQWARIWLDGGINRKVCKQPTMTFTYGSKQRGVEHQLEDVLAELDVKARAAGRPSHLPFSGPRQRNRDAARFLAPLIRAVIEKRVPAAKVAMDFLVGCARALSKRGYPMRWTTPVGVPVVQRYFDGPGRKLPLYFDGTRHQVVVEALAPWGGGSVLNKRRAAGGASPNFVHSLDSTHLLLTILRAHLDARLEDFAVVHDSFGTHATGMNALNLNLREALVTLYATTDHLATLREDLASWLSGLNERGVKLPPAPKRGALDVVAVRRSLYLFA